MYRFAQKPAALAQLRGHDFASQDLLLYSLCTERVK
jgi:hypothetical protein